MPKLSIQPLLNNVLIEPMEREQQLPSGIVIPDTAKEKPQEGKVVAVGPGKMDHGQLVKPDVKIGDHVLYKRYGGDEIKDMEGKEYLMVSSDDILAVIES
ncbi:co-chaperone GroES [candidate division WWE3 bacterium RIFCSPLOWO2_01_FULL_53_14]|uniref:Co-chaperonin GroES n=1 Tax=candidate division WWE3 bacterium RIFCSPLOWO2_01_FULL_53_14 TaxID=1802628 RepID=A0A1F4VSM0_UNCKA|nr:MAG: co-chaperone GroES [candidate division WWE3 bacterium RIFCSPLOWO2_01_FULL_53_14]